MVPYLLVADLLNTILSATLVFADRVLYPSYSTRRTSSDSPPAKIRPPREPSCGSSVAVAFLIPAMLIAIECLTRRAPMLHCKG